MRCHFWPFTEVLGRIWRFVTRKVRGLFQTPRTSGRYGLGSGRLPACRFRLLAEMHLAMQIVEHRDRFAASCRELQAGGLCSPEDYLGASAMRDGVC